MRLKRWTTRDTEAVLRKVESDILENEILRLRIDLLNLRLERINDYLMYRRSDHVDHPVSARTATDTTMDMAL